MVLLISPQTLVNEYPVDENLEQTYYLSAIKKAQDFIIKPLLGEDLYNEIITQVSGSTVSAQNETLIDDYIQPIIAYYVLGEICFATAYKMKNQGLETGDAYRFNELVKIADKYRKDSDEYQQILRKYLCDNGIVYNREKNTINYGLYLGNNYCINKGRDLPDKNK